MKALVIAESADAARELSAGARTLADEVVLATFGEAPEAVADKVAVIAVPDGAVVDDAADTLLALADAEGVGMVLVEPTRHLKTVAGKIAAAKGASTITDVMAFADGAASALYFGGVAERAMKPATDFAVYTVGSGAFADAVASGANEAVAVDWVAPAKAVELVSVAPVEKSGVDLNKADVVVAAGRGFAEESQLDMARELCDKVGGGLGCSRPLTEGVDWLPRETYIGVSGLMLSPKVYVSLGISGQMQHMVGANRSGVIFAVNKDKNAPIFKQCDYGLVGDIVEVLPALNAAL